MLINREYKVINRLSAILIQTADLATPDIIPGELLKITRFDNDWTYYVRMSDNKEYKSLAEYFKRDTAKTNLDDPVSVADTDNSTKQFSRIQLIIDALYR